MAVAPDATPSAAASDVPQTTCVTSRGRCMQAGPFYMRIRPFALTSKALATFPLHNITSRDGRELKHRWISGIFFYDLAVFMFVGAFFILTSTSLIKAVDDEEDKYHLTIWMRFTLYAAGTRNFIQFIFCHFYAHKYPQLLSTLEEYFQGIGAEVLDCRRNVIKQQLIPFLRTIGFLAFLVASSYSFFHQFPGNTWPVTISYMFINLWKELPMNMFICIIAHLQPRFDMLIDQLRKVRESAGLEDAARRLENVRLQYAALMNILGLLQKCFGMQLALNILFFILDTIMQLFIFFAVTRAQNIFMLTLSCYYFVAACGIIFFIDRLSRRTDGITDELNAFELEGKSKGVKFQVKLFVAQVTARPIMITASGFCILNNALIGSLFGAIATYLIVMINFAPFIINWTNATNPHSMPCPSHDITEYQIVRQ